MQLHQIKPIHKQKKRKRIGRGGEHGVYSGKGFNGQRSRASRKFKPVIRDVIKRYPKLRGYKFNSITKRPLVLNLETLRDNFSDGEKVTPQILGEKKIIRKAGGTFPKVKILGRGEISIALIFENCLVSKEAKKKIEKAGGQIK